MHIVGFSGKKQSGKNTCCNVVVGTVLKSIGLVKGGWIIDDSDGSLWVSDIRGNDEYQGRIDVVNSANDDVAAFLSTEVDPYVRIYAQADTLKQFCMDLMGLTYEQMYGSDEQKNSLTKFRWENMPGVVTQEIADKYGNEASDYGLYFHEPGPMTAREVMQFVGTEVFRRMYANIWNDALLKRIYRDQPLIALVCDIRFPDEVGAIQEAGGKVIRLTRNEESDSTHKSEVSLDRDVYDWNKFDHVLDNKKMDIIKQGTAVVDVLTKWGVFV